MARDIQKIAVTGAGVMGAGLAQLFAQNGYQVNLHDVSENALQRALKRAKANLGLQVEMGWVAELDSNAAMSRIEVSTALEDAVSDVDFVIEAVPEVLDLKRDVFALLESLAPPRAVLASNTSTFNVMEEVPAEVAPRVLIAHFFNPAQLVPLVEVVPGEMTEAEVVEATVRLLEGVGKVPIVLRKYLPGFAVNRIQLALNATAYSILLEGALEPEEIDRAIESSIAMRLAVNGPFATMDLTGLDVAAASARAMGLEPPAPLAELVDRGDLGVKSGKGFYEYGGESEEEILLRRDRRLMLLLEAWRKGRAR